MSQPSLPTPWEPYRPRRLPLPNASQVAAVGLLLLVGAVSLI